MRPVHDIKAPAVAILLGSLAPYGVSAQSAEEILRPTTRGTDTIHILTEAKVEAGLFEGLRHLPTTVAQPEESIACDYRGQAGFNCRSEPTGSCGARQFLPPFPIPHTDASDCPGLQEVLAWVQPGKVRDGASRLSALQEAAGGLPTCESGNCRAAIPTNEIHLEGRHVSALAECQVAKVDDRFGAPESCRIAVLIDGAQQRLQAVTALRSKASFLGRPDYAISVFSRGNASGGAIMQSIREALKREPLELETDPRVVGSTQADTVIAISEGAPSALLRKWAWVTVRVDRAEAPGGSELRLGELLYRQQADLEVSLTLMVNDQNTSGRPSDWHMPTALQFSSFLNALKIAVATAIESNCTRAEWIDSRRLLCDPA